jgi:hypothetical protein
MEPRTLKTGATTKKRTTCIRSKHFQFKIKKCLKSIRAFASTSLSLRGFGSTRFSSKCVNPLGKQVKSVPLEEHVGENCWPHIFLWILGRIIWKPDL